MCHLFRSPNTKRTRKNIVLPCSFSFVFTMKDLSDRLRFDGVCAKRTFDLSVISRKHRFRILVPQPEKSTSVNRCAFFSYIRLRRVILLRSDIRLTPSDIRFASFGGEYNITATNGSNITFAKQKYHADEVSISLNSLQLTTFML